MEYIEKIKITDNELNYYNSLLELDLDEASDYYNQHDIDRLGARQDDYICITGVGFSNGNYITIDLASGGSNYYDNIVLWNKDGQELACADCNYSIEDFELFYDGDVYKVIFELDI